MNFRTTILLLVVLVAAATLWFVVGRDETPETQQAQTDGADQPGKKLLELKAADVSKVSITPAGGQRLTLERAGPTEWNITEPIKSPAESFKADELVREVLELRTTGSQDASGKGLDQPAYVVELSDKSNNTTKLNVGMRSAVGDILYARLGDSGEAQIVSASLIDQLEKPVSDYRKMRLVTETNEKITGVTVNHGDTTLELAKTGENWKIVRPKEMPGDSGQISSLLSAITGLTAVKFVSEDASRAASLGLNKPRMTVSISTAPATTHPTTAQSRPQSQPASTVIKFGRAEDVRELNVYAIASDTGPIATVAATALDAFKKTPLELRDRAVLEVDADAVSRLTITTEKPVTTQPTQPTQNRTIALERRSEVTPAGPPAPATKPATAPTTTTAPSTVPATKPAAPQTKWLLASDPKGDANDENVAALLEALHPLRTEKYLEQFPTTQAAPAAVYVIKISTRAWADEPAKDHELRITDPGGEAKLVGQMGDLTFELDRVVLEKLTADFTAPRVEPAGPPLPALPK